MKKSRFTEEKIIEVLKQLEAGRKVSELSREYGVSTASIYAWKSKYARPGSEPAKAAQRTRRREPQAEDIGRGPELGQGGAEVGDRKNGWSR